MAKSEFLPQAAQRAPLRTGCRIGYTRAKGCARGRVWTWAQPTGEGDREPFRADLSNREKLGMDQVFVVWTSKSGLNQLRDWFFDQFENTSFPRSEPLYLVRTTKSRSRPEISGPNHFFLVQTAGVESTGKKWYKPARWFEPRRWFVPLFSGSNRK